MAKAKPTAETQLARVLVVDDDYYVRSATALFLERRGFAVSTWESIATAQLPAGTSSLLADFSVVVLDVSAVGAIEFVPLFRQHGYEGRFVMCSGDTNVHRFAANRAVAACIAKPVTLSQIAEIISHVTRAGSGSTGGGSFVARS